MSMPPQYVNQMSEMDIKEHSRKTKNLGAGYRLSNIIKVEPFMDAALKLFAEKLDDLARQSKAVHWDYWFFYLAMDTVGEATFSQGFGMLEAGRDIGNMRKNIRFLRTYMAAMISFAPARYLVALVTPLTKYLRSTPVFHLFDVTMSAIESRSNNPAVRKDMFEEWKIQLAKYPERMDAVELIGASLLTVAAGGESTSTVLQAVVYYMLHDPEMLAMLRKELDTAGLSGFPTYEETQRLPILQACIREAYRVHPP